MTRWTPYLLVPLVVIAVPLGRPATASGRPLQATPADVQRTVWNGVYTEEQAARGQIQYTEACASCHAPDLRGNTTSPSLVGMSFTFLWGGSTLGELLGNIQQLMPTDRPNSLPAQTYRDILTFILQANSYPAGEQELEADGLDEILITEKPNPEP
jgi:S-disulfanyl-L-cysteine oxidoreductase SoxD